MATSYNLTYIETSAKVGTNIDEAYEQAAVKVLDKINKKIIDIQNDRYGVKAGLLSERSSFPAINTEKKKCCGS